MTTRHHHDGESDEGPRLGAVLLRGLQNRCPQCGRGPLYRRYLKLVDTCAACHEGIGAIRADDLPAYLTIFLVGHIVVPLALLAEKMYAPPVWLHFSIWLPSIMVLTLIVLPGIKGATVGLMWKLGLRGDERQ